MAVERIFNAVLNYEKDQLPVMVRAEVDAGTAVSKILNDGLIAAMEEVGRGFSAGEIFIPEMLQAAQTMKSGLAVLRPLLSDTDIKQKGTIVIGTVKGDLHDIGKNLVSMMLEGAGFEVIDLGVDVGTEAFISGATENNAEIIALSALLTTTMPAMEATIAAIKKKKLPLKIIVGGAPVTQEFADKIGANDYGSDGPSAVEAAQKLMAE